MAETPKKPGDDAFDDDPIAEILSGDFELVLGDGEALGDLLGAPPPLPPPPDESDVFSSAAPLPPPTPSPPRAIVGATPTVSVAAPTVPAGTPTVPAGTTAVPAGTTAASGTATPIPAGTPAVSGTATAVSSGTPAVPASTTAAHGAATAVPAGTPTVPAGTTASSGAAPTVPAAPARRPTVVRRDSLRAETDPAHARRPETHAEPAGETTQISDLPSELAARETSPEPGNDDGEGQPALATVELDESFYDGIEIGGSHAVSRPATGAVRVTRNVIRRITAAAPAAEPPSPTEDPLDQTGEFIGRTPVVRLDADTAAELRGIGRRRPIEEDGEVAEPAADGDVEEVTSTRDVSLTLDTNTNEAQAEFADDRAVTEVKSTDRAPTQVEPARAPSEPRAASQPPPPPPPDTVAAVGEAGLPPPPPPLAEPTPIAETRGDTINEAIQVTADARLETTRDIVSAAPPGPTVPVPIAFESTSPAPSLPVSESPPAVAPAIALPELRIEPGRFVITEQAARPLDDDVTAAQGELLELERELERTTSDPARAARTRLAAAHAAERAGDLPRAREHYEEACLADQALLPAARGLRRLLLRSGDHLGAVHHLDVEVALGAPAERPALAAFRADLLVAIGEQDLARVAFGELCDARKDDLRALLGAMELAYSDDRDDELAWALRTLAALVDDAPLKAAMTALLARVHERMGSIGEAEEAYRAALAASDADRTPWLGLWRIALAAGRTADATAIAAKLFENIEDPGLRAAVARRRAAATLASGDSAGAIAVLEEAGTVEDPLVLEGMADAYQAAGRTAEAALAFEAWAKVEPWPARRAQVLRRLAALHAHDALEPASDARRPARGRRGRSRVTPASSPISRP